VNEEDATVSFSATMSFHAVVKSEPPKVTSQGLGFAVLHKTIHCSVSIPDSHFLNQTTHSTTTQHTAIKITLLPHQKTRLSEMSSSQPQDQPEASSSSSAAPAQGTSPPPESFSNPPKKTTPFTSPHFPLTHILSEIKHCAQCNKAEEDPESKPLKPCTTCKSVVYCSRECTKAHYKTHKKECAKLAQEYSKTAVFKPVVRSGAPKEGFKGGLQKWQFDT
jgi:sulfatase maturation enzyme AslB (radical SAM superfamily)